MSYPPQPPPPPPPPEPPQEPDEFAFDPRGPARLRAAADRSRPARRPDKAPRLALLLATVLWPVVAVAAGAVRYGMVKSQAGAYFAREASYETITTVTSLYFLTVLICLAWWFYAKD